MDEILKIIPPDYRALTMVLGLLGSHMWVMWARTAAANVSLSKLASLVDMLMTPDPLHPHTPRVIWLLENAALMGESIHKKIDALTLEIRERDAQCVVAMRKLIEKVDEVHNTLTRRDT